MNALPITDIGLKRRSNQDFVYISKEPVGNLPNLFIVADGMGGHNAGDFASEYSVDEFIGYVKECTSNSPIKIITNAIEVTNSSLIEKSTSCEELKGMGTTLVAATIYDNHIYIANVGDSRLYVIDSDIKQITKDHSLVEEMIEEGTIERKDMRIHPNKNIITRAIGVHYDIAPDFFELDLEKDDIILMCSDALTNMVDDQEIRDIVSKNKENLDIAIKRLVDRANEQGGKDNISVIIVKL